MAEPQGVLLKAIVTAFNAAATLDNIAGPHLHEVPPNNSAFPYCVLDPIRTNKLGETCQSELWEHVVDFQIYSTTPELASQQAGLVDAVFSSNSLSLTLDEGECFFWRLESPQAGHEDKNVNSTTLTYRFRTRRNRIS